MLHRVAVHRLIKRPSLRHIGIAACPGDCKSAGSEAAWGGVLAWREAVAVRAVLKEELERLGEM